MRASTTTRRAPDPRPVRASRKLGTRITNANVGLHGAPTRTVSTYGNTRTPPESARERQSWSGASTEASVREHSVGLQTQRREAQAQVPGQMWTCEVGVGAGWHAVNRAAHGSLRHPEQKKRAATGPRQLHLQLERLLGCSADAHGVARRGGSSRSRACCRGHGRRMRSSSIRSVDAEAFTWTDRSPDNGIGVTCHAMRVRLKELPRSAQHRLEVWSM